MENTGENSPQITRLTDSSCSFSSIPENNEIPDKEECLEVEDNRISCSSEANLDKIMKIVARNVETFAKSACSEDKKSQFVSRTLEVFKDYIQENVTIKGLPYSVNAECLSPNEKELQSSETKDALFAELSKKIEVCASKRKEYPKNYCRIYDMRLQHERQNLKKSKCKHAVHVPLISEKSLETNLSPQNLNEAAMSIKSSHVQISNAVKELTEIRKNLDFAQELMVQKPYIDALQDTGYNSS